MRLAAKESLEEVGGFSSDFSCENIELTFRTHEQFLRESRAVEFFRGHRDWEKFERNPRSAAAAHP